MHIKQIQLAYAPEHDRILMRINSNDHLEVRCWLTRRMIKLLLPSLENLMKKYIRGDKPLNEETKKALLDMNREASLQHADFQSQFQEDNNQTPMGAEPLLISHMELMPVAELNKTDILLKLCASDARGFEICMAEPLQHGLLELLIRTCQQAMWDLPLLNHQHTELDEELTISEFKH